METHNKYCVGKILFANTSKFQVVKCSHINLWNGCFDQEFNDGFFSCASWHRVQRQAEPSMKSFSLKDINTLYYYQSECDVDIKTLNIKTHILSAIAVIALPHIMIVKSNLILPSQSLINLLPEAITAST